jgi:hypothetical protein
MPAILTLPNKLSFLLLLNIMNKERENLQVNDLQEVNESLDDLQPFHCHLSS